MDSQLDLEKPQRITGIQKLGSSLLAVISVYFILQIGSYFFPVIRVFDSSFVLYLIALIGVYAIAFQFGFYSTMGSSLVYSTLFLVYYLYSLGDDPEKYQKFLQIRNVYYGGFVVVIVLVGIGLMLRTVLPKSLVLALQSLTAFVVVALVLLTFSYALSNLVGIVLRTLGI